MYASNSNPVQKQTSLSGSYSRGRYGFGSVGQFGWIIAALTLLWLSLPQSGQSQNTQKIRLEFHGLNDATEIQVRDTVGEPPGTPLDAIPDYVEELKNISIRSLQATGYYHSSVTAKHASYRSSTTIALYFKLGSPVRIRNLDIKVNLEARELKEFQNAIRQMPLAEQNVFDHGKYEDAKNSLLKTAQLLGFFDAKFTRSQVLISKRDSSADVFLNFETGKRYTIDKVVYKQNLYSEEFLNRWQNFQAAVPYRANYISDLTVNLQNSGYFKNVRVTPDIQRAVNHNIPLIVELEPVKENTVSIGAGFATDSGPRVKSNWFRPHTNKLGHSLESKASVSDNRQDVSVSYRIPQNKNPANNSYTLDAGLLNRKTDNTFAQLRTFEVTDNHLTRSKWRREIFLRFENETFNIGGDKDQIKLLLPGIGFSRVESTGGIHPSKGRYFSFQVMAARRSLGSDIDMSRASAATKILNSWGNKHYLIARLELGALRTNSFSRVPSTHRFFAGGDNSIRGYGYQEISPQNDENEFIGGQYLTTASVEYNHYFNERFALAAFVDSGKAFVNSSDATRTGVGLGLRWRSPVGPLRIDFAHGLNNENSPYRVHLAIGPEL